MFICVGVVTVAIVDEVITDLSLFLSSPTNPGQLFRISTPSCALCQYLVLVFVWTLLLLCLFLAAETQLCVNVVLSLSYTFQWKGNGITAISVIRRIGNITFSPGGESVFARLTIFMLSNMTAVKPNCLFDTFYWLAVFKILTTAIRGYKQG